MASDSDSDVALEDTALASEPDRLLGLTRTEEQGPLERDPGSPASGALGPGDVIGRFEIEACIGRGGMGEVFSARDPDLHRTVALKLLRADASGGPTTRGRRQRLLREARAMARLEHPNVLTVYEVGRVDERDYIAMAHVDGHSLDVWLTQQTRSWREVLAVFLEAARGLHAAHQAGLIHRDFKPSNVLVGRDGRVHVMDFGLARMDDGPSSPSVDGDSVGTAGSADDGGAAGRPAPEIALTQTGTLLGTPLYMAPEQHRGEPTDARTDQYSFCASLFQGIFGIAPFSGTDLESLHQAKRQRRFARSDSAQAVPSHVHEAIMRGLAVAADERFPSMDELIQALSPARSRRTRTLVLALAAALVLGAVGLAVSRWTLPPPPPAASARSGLPAPDPAIAADVAAIRAELAAVTQPPWTERSRTRLAALGQRADELGFAPLRAESLLARAEAAHIDIQAKPARKLLEEVRFLAQELSYHAVHTQAVVAAAELEDMFMAGAGQRDELVQQATALLERHGGTATVRARLDVLHAKKLSRQQEYRRAASLLDAAEGIFRAQGDHLRAGLTARLLGQTRLSVAAFAQAAESLQVSCTTLREALGPRHMHTVQACGLRTNTVSMLGDSDRALRHVLEEDAWWAKAAARRTFIASFTERPAGAQRTLRGRVLDPAGQPVVGAQVAIGPVLISGGRHLVERFAALTQLTNGAVVTITDAEGRFELAEITTAPLLVSADRAGVGRAPTATVPAEATDIELVLTPVAGIRGQLTASEDPGTRYVVVANTVLSADGMEHRYDVLVAEDGSFAIDNLAPGSYHFYVADHLQRVLPATGGEAIALESGQQARIALTLSAAKTTVDVSVVVRSRMGMSVPAALVLVLPAGVQASGFVELQKHARAAQTESRSSAPTTAKAGSNQVEVQITDVTVGPHTVCVVVLPADFTDPAVRLKLQSEETGPPIACQQAEISGQPLVLEI